MNPFIQVITAFILGATLVYFAVPVIVKLSVTKKLYDLPDERKLNKDRIPTLGGIAIFIGVSLATLLTIYKLSFPELRYIFAATIIMFFVGIRDDLMIMSADKKLIAQILCALILIIPENIRFTNLYGLFGWTEINYMASFTVSFLTILAIINAMNLIDGIDGLASSIAGMASLFFGVLFFNLGEFRYAILSFSIAGSLFTFFFYNVFGRDNKIFMGDTGSLILGLLLAVLTIKFNEISFSVKHDHFAPVLSMAILIVPLYDMVRIALVRIFRKKSPFTPDTNHIHHKLIRLGFSHLQSSIILISVNLFLILSVYLLRFLDIHIQVLALIFLAGAFSLVPEISKKRTGKNVDQ